ncbi:MAG: NAD(P)-dependent oxidoreductase [Patescibacteria group bacterium]
MKKLKIFLTGGGGFIGRNILELLGHKYDFLYPARAELDLTNVDAVWAYLKKNKFDLVIHAANVGGTRSPKWVGVEWVLEKNLQMFFNLVRGKDFYKRLIVLGSGAEYDKTRGVAMAKEDDFDKSVPVDQYGFAKYIMSKYAQTVDFITHLRSFAVYGKYEDYQIRFIPEAIYNALLDIPITIKQNVNYDYLYINDFAKILDYFIANKPPETFYNVGRGETIDLITIAKKVLALTGKNVPIVVQNPEMNKEYSGNIDKLKTAIGEISFTDLDKSLADLVEYYRPLVSKLDS